MEQLVAMTGWIVNGNDGVARWRADLALKKTDMKTSFVGCYLWLSESIWFIGRVLPFGIPSSLIGLTWQCPFYLPHMSAAILVRWNGGVANKISYRFIHLCFFISYH